MISRLRVATLGLVLAGIPACQAYPPSSAAPAPSAASIDSTAIDSVASAIFALDIAPGMSVVVVRGFGFADLEARLPRD